MSSRRWSAIIWAHDSAHATPDQEKTPAPAVRRARREPQHRAHVRRRAGALHPRGRVRARPARRSWHVLRRRRVGARSRSRAQAAGRRRARAGQPLLRPQPCRGREPAQRVRTDPTHERHRGGGHGHPSPPLQTPVGERELRSAAGRAARGNDAPSCGGSTRATGTGRARRRSSAGCSRRFAAAASCSSTTAVDGASPWSLPSRRSSGGSTPPGTTWLRLPSCLLGLRVLLDGVGRGRRGRPTPHPSLRAGLRPAARSRSQ